MLALEDRIAIQDLYSRLCVLNDLGDNENWAKCFTEDGTYIVKSEIRGRAALIASAEEKWKERQKQPYTNSQHWVGNLVVDGDSERASGFCYIIRVARMNDTQELKVISQNAYEDKLHKVNGKWLLHNRRIHSVAPPLSAFPLR